MFWQNKYRFYAVLLTLGIFAYSQRTFAAPQSEAYLGQPFGVGRVTVDVLRGEPAVPLSDERFTVLGDSNQVFYPVLKEQPGRQLLRQLLEIETPRAVTIYFLFRGDEPFDLFPFTPVEQAVRIKPQNNPQKHRQLLDQWWQQYAGRWQRLLRNPEYPPIVENFLVATMARRLGRSLPESKPSILPWSKQQEASAFEALFASESYQLRSDIAMLSHQGTDDSLHNLPEGVSWVKPDVPNQGLDEVPLEPIATYVPEECFYLRFGNFLNYLWFRDLNKKWDGDLGNMLTRRGIDRASSLRTQQQLSLRESALAKILGPQVIADAAIIGLDPYVQHGAGIGILFQAKNNFLLNQDLMKQRREALSKYPEAGESTLKIAEQEVSFIGTDDGRVRSYYVQTKDFHLVTTSSTLVQRFVEAGQGTGSLANLASFRNARREISLQREDDLFAFVSPLFFQNLCSPRYRIELQRRVRSARESNLIALAKLVALQEGLESQKLEELVEANYLPHGFAKRLDESLLEETDAGTVDTKRGALGFFVPVADISVGQIAKSELIAYQKFHREISGRNRANAPHRSRE